MSSAFNENLSKEKTDIIGHGRPIGKHGEIIFSCPNQKKKSRSENFLTNPVLVYGIRFLAKWLATEENQSLINDFDALDRRPLKLSSFWG